MDQICWGDDDKYEGSDSSEDESVSTGYEINSLDQWKDKVAQWVFRSQPDDTPDEKIIEYFNVWGDDATNKILTDKLTRIRDASLQERMGEISDAHAITKVEASGNAQAGYNMRVSRELYSQRKFKLLQESLRGEIDKAFIDLRTKRTEDIASGTVKEREKTKISQLAKPKSLRKTAKTTFEKVRAEKKGRAGAKEVHGSTAAAAIQEANSAGPKG